MFHEVNLIVLHQKIVSVHNHVDNYIQMWIYCKLALNVQFSIYCIDVGVGDGAVMFWYQDRYILPSQLSGNSGSTDVVQIVF